MKESVLDAVRKLEYTTQDMVEKVVENGAKEKLTTCGCPDCETAASELLSMLSVVLPEPRKRSSLCPLSNNIRESIQRLRMIGKRFTTGGK
jgi:hypothetical protein